jgi:hypothetical protein
MFDYINLLLSVQEKIKIDESNVDLRVKEAFLLWYVNLELIDHGPFSEATLTNDMRQNFIEYKEKFSSIPEYTFILGWMVGITPYYYMDAVDDNIGPKLLQEAYLSNRKNPLFALAIEEKLNLSDDSISKLKHDLAKNFSLYFKYDEGYVQDYFTGVYRLKTH